jgi:hypothetical protein
MQGWVGAWEFSVDSFSFFFNIHICNKVLTHAKVYFFQIWLSMSIVRYPHVVYWVKLHRKNVYHTSG